MKIMKKSLLLKRITPLIVIVYCVSCNGCSSLRDTTTEDNLNVVLEGMAEKEVFSFEGAATLLRGGEPLPNSTLYYGGEVEELTKLSLYTLLSDRSLSNKTASSGVKDLKNSGSLVQSYYSHLEKKAGKWELQAATHSPQEFNPLPALNPLAQLEGLKEVEKQVTEEVGAGRGTKVLRFELAPAEARNQLTHELDREMMILRPELHNDDQKSTEDELKLTKARIELWQKKNSQLQQKLEQAKIETVYYLTLDKKYNLPRRLTLNRKVSYPSESNKSAIETYVTQVYFYDYR